MWKARPWRQDSARTVVGSLLPGAVLRCLRAEEVDVFGPPVEAVSQSVFAATHTAPAGGLATYMGPDPAAVPNSRLDPYLEVQVLERLGVWARIACSNGWSAWVDGRNLVAVGAGQPPLPPAPMAAAQATSGQLTPARTLTAAGGLAVAVSALLPWFSMAGLPGVGPFKIPIQALWSSTTSATAANGPGLLSVGVALLLIAAAGIAAAFVPTSNWVRTGAGAAALVMPSAWTKQLLTVARQLNQLGGGTRVSVIGLVGIGVYVSLAGGVLLLVGSSAGRAGGPAR